MAGYESGIQNLSNFSQKAGAAKGFLQEGGAAVQDTAVNNDVIRVPGHVKNLERRKT